MSTILTSIKKFFTSGQTVKTISIPPVQGITHGSIGTRVPPVPTSSSIPKGKVGAKSKINYLKIFSSIRRFIMFISSVFAGAIILETISFFQPGIVEKIPSLFQIIDLLLYVLEYICYSLIQIFA